MGNKNPFVSKKMHSPKEKEFNSCIDRSNLDLRSERDKSVNVKIRRIQLTCIQRPPLGPKIVTTGGLGSELPKSWRTLAYQEVIFRIGPLARQGRFQSTADFFVNIASISLESGLILYVLPPGWLKFSMPKCEGNRKFKNVLY
jgi:hypothetical protein